MCRMNENWGHEWAREVQAEGGAGTRACGKKRTQALGASKDRAGVFCFPLHCILLPPSSPRHPGLLTQCRAGADFSGRITWWSWGLFLCSPIFFPLRTRLGCLFLLDEVGQMTCFGWWDVTQSKEGHFLVEAWRSGAHFAMFPSPATNWVCFTVEALLPWVPKGEECRTDPSTQTDMEYELKMNVYCAQPLRFCCFWQHCTNYNILYKLLCDNDNE